MVAYCTSPSPRSIVVIVLFSVSGVVTHPTSIIFFYDPPSSILLHSITVSLLPLFPPSSLSYLFFFQLLCVIQPTVLSAIETTYTTANDATISATNEVWWRNVSIPSSSPLSVALRVFISVFGFVTHHLVPSPSIIHCPRSFILLHSIAFSLHPTLIPPSHILCSIAFCCSANRRVSHRDNLHDNRRCNHHGNPVRGHRCNQQFNPVDNHHVAPRSGRVVSRANNRRCVRQDNPHRYLRINRHENRHHVLLDNLRLSLVPSRQCVLLDNLRHIHQVNRAVSPRRVLQHNPRGNPALGHRCNHRRNPYRARRRNHHESQQGMIAQRIFSSPPSPTSTRFRVFYSVSRVMTLPLTV